MTIYEQNFNLDDLRAVDRANQAARELLPPDLALELELRQTEIKLAAVQAAIRKLEEGYER